MNEKQKKWINTLIYVFGYFLTLYMLFHIDYITESVYSLKADSSMTAIAQSITVGCNDTICSIKKINEWVYNNVKTNNTYGTSPIDAIRDILYNSPKNIIKNGGVCRHKTLLALSLIKSLNIKGCRPKSIIVIDNGLSVGHMMFECNINSTHIECDPTYGNCSVVKNG